MGMVRMRMRMKGAVFLSVAARYECHAEGGE